MNGHITRRQFVAGMGVSACAVGLGGCSTLTDRRNERNVQLLHDTRFRRGCDVLDGIPGSAATTDPLHGDVIGCIGPIGATGLALWRAAQWYSRFNLAEAKAEKLGSGATRYFDGAKSVIFGDKDEQEADLILGVNGRTEFNDIAPSGAFAWPHLLVAQKLSEGPSIAEYESVPIGISYRLLHAEAHRGPGWSDQRHAAQFLLYLTIHNYNRSSVGFGDYLWFGVPMFDARRLLPRRFTAGDAGNANKQATGRFIYVPAGETYSKEPAINRRWITINHDVLPLIHEALETAWASGYLPGSRKAGDYYLGGLTLGWEVTGPWDVAMQVRDLSLSAIHSKEA